MGNLMQARSDIAAIQLIDNERLYMRELIYQAQRRDL